MFSETSGGTFVWVVFCPHHCKYEWFSDLITVRTRKTRTNQVVYCFWWSLPLCTHRHMYHYRSSPSCIHLQLYVKGSVHLFSRNRETMSKISQESLVMSLFVRCTVCYSVLVLRMSGSVVADAHKSCPSWLCRHIPSSPTREETPLRWCSKINLEGFQGRRSWVFSRFWSWPWGPGK